MCKQKVFFAQNKIITEQWTYHSITLSELSKMGRNWSYKKFNDIGIHIKLEKYLEKILDKKIIMFIHFRNNFTPLYTVYVIWHWWLSCVYQVDQKKYHATYQDSAVAKFPCYHFFHTSEYPIPWLTLLFVLGKNRVNRISC